MSQPSLTPWFIAPTPMASVESHYLPQNGSFLYCPAPRKLPMPRCPAAKSDEALSSLCLRGFSWNSVCGEGHQVAFQRSTSLSSQLMSLASSPSSTPNPTSKKGLRMARRMIWIEDDRFSGWCCSHCEWDLTVPRLDSNVAALAFNRVAQENFETHECPMDQLR
jgi:hypothetical protein